MSFKFKVVNYRVIDGDTVDVDIDLGFDVILAKQRVRLFGIDAPESRTSDKEEKVFGRLTKETVKAFFAESAEVWMLSKKFQRGKFGRILGDFTNGVDSLTLCEYLVEENLAVPYLGESKELIEAAHLKNREILKDAGIV